MLRLSNDKLNENKKTSVHWLFNNFRYLVIKALQFYSGINLNSNGS